MQITGEVPLLVSVAEFKRALHILHDDDDPLFDGLLRAAQATVEDATRRPLTPRPVEFQFRPGTATRWWVPVCPVVSVTEVAVQAGDGSFSAISAATYRLEQAADEPSILFLTGALAGLAQGGLVRVRCAVGGGRERVALRQAIILLAKDHYEAGIAVEEKKFLEVSFGCKALMKQQRYMRPRELA